MNYEYLDQSAEKLKNQEALPEWLQHAMPIHLQLRLARETLGMTQQQLASFLNKTQPEIARIEKGTTGVNIDTLTKIARALHSELKLILVPKKNLRQIVEEKAEEKAKLLIDSSCANSKIEKQGPSQTTIERRKEKTKYDLIDNNRRALWD